MKRFVFNFFAIAVGLMFACTVAWIAGENPIDVLSILFFGAFGSLSNIGYTIYYATPLILTGLSVSWALKSGLFNIGAEGQMCMGGLTALAMGLWVGEQSVWIAWPMIMASAFLGGGVWGGIVGWIRAKRGVHEVLGTILMNFVSYGVVAYFILNVLRNTKSQAPETLELNLALRLPVIDFFSPSPVNLSLVVGLIACLISWIVLNRTRFGFYQRMAGGAPRLGRLTGRNMSRELVMSLFISGGLAGLASLNDVLSYSMKLKEGFTAGAGFMGIAVAMMARGSSVGVVLSALLFGALQKGSLDLDLDTEKITRDIAYVIQASIILCVVSESVIEGLYRRFVRRFSGGQTRV